MRILVANPNATEAITDVCLALARGAASPGTELTGWTNRQGPPIIDSCSKLRKFAPPPRRLAEYG